MYAVWVVLRAELTFARILLADSCCSIQSECGGGVRKHDTCEEEDAAWIRQKELLCINFCAVNLVVFCMQFGVSVDQKR